MTGQDRTPAEQEAVDLVIQSLVQGSTGVLDVHWEVYPFLDAFEVCPVTTKRGMGTYLVRRGVVRQVPSNGMVTVDEVHRQMVTHRA